MRNTLLLTALICATALPGKSGTLGIWTGSFGGTATNTGQPITGTLAIGPTSEFFCPATDCPAFFQQAVTPSDVGTSYTFDSGSANFDQAVGLFTDNQLDYVWELGTSTTGGGAGNGAYESIRFNLPGVDFSDDTIISIVTTITSHTFIAPNSFDRYDFQVQVNGTEGTSTGGGGTSTAPEPSTWLLMLTGPAAIAVFRRLVRSS
ncbi:MAG TPA: hypothetical protein VG273_23350 [Bryobacteraceae bacterium]|nr:hypothetical protein [Bryobacteraceae bacterium]